MGKPVIHFLFLFFTNLFHSCNQNEEKGISDSGIFQPDSVKTSSQKINELDSIIIKYWKSEQANEYFFLYLQNKIKISSKYFSFNKEISDKTLIATFADYVDEFYINKKSEINYGVTKEPAPVADYSRIKVQGFKNSKEFFLKETTLYSNIKFNPRFVEFYKFLDILVSEK